MRERTLLSVREGCFPNKNAEDNKIVLLFLQLPYTACAIGQAKPTPAEAEVKVQRVRE